MSWTSPPTLAELRREEDQMRVDHALALAAETLGISDVEQALDPEDISDTVRHHCADLGAYDTAQALVDLAQHCISCGGVLIGKERNFKSCGHCGKR